MAKPKNAPARKPVKARGAVKAPRTAPQRRPSQWYKRKGFRILAAILAAAVFIVLIKAVFDFRQRAEAKRNESRAVQQFDRRVQTLKAPLQEILQATSKTTGEFTAGTLPKDQYTKAVDGWLGEFRKFDSALRNRKIPPGIEELEDVRALYVQAAVTFIDAGKSFQLAANLEPPARDDSIKQANNLIAHGQAASSLGDRVMQRLKIRYDLSEPAQGAPGQPAVEPSVPPIQLPPEDAPPPAAPGGEVPGGQIPGGLPGGQIPGVPPG